MINNKISFLNVFSVKNNLIEYKCPSCGNVCNEKTKKCEICDYNLNEYRNIIMSKYVHFNESIKCIKNKDYFNALLAITRFLAFVPNNEKGNEIYIYLLHKNKRYDEYNKQLELFEKNFKYSSFIIDLEQKGIEKYVVPNIIDIDIEYIDNSFDVLTDLYNSNKYKTVNDIIELQNGFFDIVQYNKEKNKDKKIQDFYDKRFLQFLSKFEIFVEQNDGKNYDELSDNDKKKIEVIGETEAVRKKVGTIVTVSPTIYMRKKVLSKEKALVVRKNKRW